MCWDDEPIKLSDCSRPCSQHVFPLLLPFKPRNYLGDLGSKKGSGCAVGLQEDQFNLHVAVRMETSVPPC